MDGGVGVGLLLKSKCDELRKYALGQGFLCNPGFNTVGSLYCSPFPPLWIKVSNLTVTEL